MTPEEVRVRIDLALTSIRQALAAIDEADRTADFSRQMQDLKESTIDLNRALKAIGGSGNVCPQCGGSGRV